MVFVVIEEVVPESLQHGFEATATSGFLAGFLIMMILDIGLV
jgi:ZIP family zinc transporter